MAKVALVLGSFSDFPVVQDTVKTLKEFGVEVDAHVLSAHRTPDETASFAKKAEESGVDVIIAVAGKAAHLPGVIAAYTILPVIGLPIKSSTMDGLDSLLSMVQMPGGVPVATVTINGGLNAALLALSILSIKYPELNKKLKDYRNNMKNKVYEQDSKLKQEVEKL